MPNLMLRLRVGLAMAAASLVIAAGVAARARADAPKTTPEQAEFFETSVRPVLVESCGKCHGRSKQSSGLRLDSREAVLEGGVNGPSVVPGDPDGSLLIQVVRQTHDDIKMPPKGKLPRPAVDALAQWVKMGAPWPRDTPKRAGPTPAASADPAGLHWAFRPVKPVVPPAVRGAGWVRNPVDSFLLARLEKDGLAPSPEADRRTLIRRATFDLTGLPPTQTEVFAFVADERPDAYERLVDRLLASPHYGERWGRHWLDVARYADTKGYVFMEERRYPYSYTYRDYVIGAFNNDLPYNQFVLEQLAADRLGPGQDPRSLAALGFLTLGRRFLNVQADIIDDRIDVVTRGLLGLTVGCARCHDHKYDPIPTDDYYSLYGVFASSVEPADPPEIPAPVPEALRAEFRTRLATKQKDLDAFLAEKRGAIQSDLRGRVAAYVRAAFDLGFDGRNPKLNERAAADKLTPGRLRGVAFRWKQKLDATRDLHDPVFAPWHAFAALPAAEFSRKAPGVARSLAATGDAEAAHPVLAQSFAERPPATMAEVAARYGSVLAELNRRWDEALRADPNAAALGDAPWESLRQAFYGDAWPLSVSLETLPRLLDRDERNRFAALKREVDRLKSTHPGSPPRAMVLNDAPQPVQPVVFLRGNPGRPGKAVPRQFLAVLSGPSRKPFTDGSGRLELARAIASADNPLTARVLVNRVWWNHFGTGLVATPSDFGRRSDPPTHPELLDWLAADFVAHGWSVKALHRRIMLSSAYRQRSDPRPDLLARDPENRLYGRFNRRRLDFESTRDALLATSGALNPVMGGLGVPITEPPYPPRRTVYGFIDRQNLDGLYRTFDFAGPDSSSPRRFVTTVPQQALFLMNSPFVLEQAHRLAALPELAVAAPEGRVRALYRRVFARDPDPRELALGVGFLAQQSGPEGNGRRPVWERPGGGRRSGTAGLTPWEEYAQVLLLTNEFAFVD